MAQSKLNGYEAERLSKLVGLELLDSDPESMFDDLVKVAKVLTGAPIAAISLIDDKRAWFKSCDGLDAPEAPRNVAFCDYTIKNKMAMNIPDLTKDARFAENPLVTGGPMIRMYVGIPLWTRDGYCLGSLCVMDTSARELSQSQIEALEALGRQLMLNVEARQKQIEQKIDALLNKNIRPGETDIAKNLNIGVYVIDRDGRCTFANDAALRITGLTKDQALGYGYFGNVMEEDRLELFELVQNARRNREPFDMVYRVRFKDGTVRYLENYSAPNHDGNRIGTIIDVTSRVEREAALVKELLRLREPVMIKRAE